jgi:hypothetical protein
MEPMDGGDLHLKLHGLDYLCGTRRCQAACRAITGDHIL